MKIGSIEFNSPRYELYLKDPKAALEAAFEEANKDRVWSQGKVFLWSGGASRDGTRYGRYNYITKEMLEGRQYDIEFWDGQVTIFWTDVWYNPRTYKYEPKEMT